MEYSKKIKTRIRVLVFLACLAVALVFGLSYYFGLIATESSITSKVPELEGLVGKFKSTLLVNTIIFVGVIIASFFALSVLLTERMFKPLGSLHTDIDLLAGGQLPGCDSDQEHGPFGSLETSFRSACKRIQSHTRGLIADLEKAREIAGTNDECAEKLNEIIDKNKRFLGEIEPAEKPKSDAEADDPIFMQPV
jgi:hypothetical protein